ncbi:MAG: ureidoglycolate lyase [Gammaproteobacteria bacterium]|nr:ureidoglycolate lyase [Gammaproteobacteria bacterium]
MPVEVLAEPLTCAAFAPFGTVIESLSKPGRVFFNDDLGSARPRARFDLSLARLEPMAALTLEATELERHEFSSQTFLPLDVGRYLVIVAPSAPDGGPSVAGARAFVADGRQGITYRRNTWHHGLKVLDRPAQFAVLMWCDGTSGDEEFRALAQPFTVTVPG